MIDRAALPGRWVHAHERDSEGEMVFVPAEEELPPSRGRQQLELAEGGGARELGPGATDRPEAREASWELTEDDQLIIHDRDGRQAWRARVLAAKTDRLVLDKRSLR
jgi:hypothetical protein